MANESPAVAAPAVAAAPAAPAKPPVQFRVMRAIWNENDDPNISGPFALPIGVPRRSGRGARCSPSGINLGLGAANYLVRMLVWWLNPVDYVHCPVSIAVVDEQAQSCADNANSD